MPVSARAAALLADAEEEQSYGSRIMFQIASDVAPSKPDWLVRGWLLSRALNLLTGRQGCGKTTFAAYLISGLTHGLPLLGEDGHEPIKCAILSLEEPPDRVVARLHAAGADLSMVNVLGDVEDHDDDGKPFRRRWSLPGDIAILGTLINQQAIGLVIIDGLGYSISGDSHNYAVVGSALAALAGVAEQSGAAILGLVHPPKGSSDPVTAAIGSTAWTAIPRIALVLGVDPNDENGLRRVVRVGKTNYREPDTGFGFTMGNDPEWECGFVMGMRQSNITAEDIVSAPVSHDEKGERAEARDVLRTLLADGPMDSNDAVKASGIGERTLKRARGDIGVRSEARRNDLGRVVGWTWSLPQGQSANTTGPTGTWHSGHSGHTQDLLSVSAPEGQESKAGTLDVGATS